MGLRIKIIASLLAIMAVLALLSTQILQGQLATEFAEQERIQVEKDMRRLLLALDFQMTEVDVILGSWSNYTGLYDYAAHPTAKFRQDELNPDSLRAAHFDWFALTNPRHEITEFSEVARADGKRPLQSLRNAAGNLPGIALGELLSSRDHGCGLVNLAEQLSFLCFRPLLTSDVKGPAHGHVVIGRNITAAMLSAIGKETGLSFELAGVAPTAPSTDEPVTLKALVGQGSLALEEHASHLEGSFALIGLAGHPIGAVRLHWARDSQQHMLEAQQSVLKVVLMLILATGVAALLIVDRLVVRRLQRIQRELSQILAQENWSGQIQVSGHDEIADLGRFANSMMRVIQKKLAQLRDMALHDTLTGLPNRRQFDESLQRALAQFQRSQQPGALILLDVDYFKLYNDRYGHPAGDQALVQVARCLRTAARRPADLAARMGGEEFALLLEQTDAAGARECAERARSLLLQTAIVHAGNPNVGFVTLSAGVTLFLPGDTPEAIYARADAALYSAKSEGRNRIALR